MGSLLQYQSLGKLLNKIFLSQGLARAFKIHFYLTGVYRRISSAFAVMRIRSLLLSKTFCEQLP